MPSGKDLSYDDVAEILRLIESSNIDELHLVIGDMILDVRRNGTGRASGSETNVRIPEVPARPAPARSQEPAAPVARPTDAPKSAALSDGRFSIKAPMLGTFYRAPSPTAAPFVEVGSVVESGETLCIIEVMKLMNTIAADRAGRIVEIPAVNGAIVEFGEDVIILEPL